MDEFKLSEYDILTRPPEELMVGQLNRAVRELRERLYQQRLRFQELEQKTCDHKFVDSLNCIKCSWNSRANS